MLTMKESLNNSSSTSLPVHDGCDTIVVGLNNNNSSSSYINNDDDNCSDGDGCSVGVVVLFYKYFIPQSKYKLFHLYSDSYYVSKIKDYLTNLCTTLQLKGRILLASEGINGTLSAQSITVLNQFIQHMESFNISTDIPLPESYTYDNDVECCLLFDNIDWKTSSTTINSDGIEIEPFSDLKVSIVKEVISTGGTVSAEDIVHYGGTHLSPTEFHLALQNANNNNNNNNKTILIDIRNTFEYNIGHFIIPTTNQPAINPETITFSSLEDTFLKKHIPEWTRTTNDNNTNSDDTKLDDTNNNNNDDENDTDNKDGMNMEQHQQQQQQEVSQSQPTVLMYCTGGIRCEKASVLFKKKYNIDNVYQLQGGIHRYIEQYGSTGYFQGLNFVFDQRTIQKPSDYNNKVIVPICNDNDDTTSKSNTSNTVLQQSDDSNKKLLSDEIIGQCIECTKPFDILCGSRVCTVCRDLVLVCNTCQQTLREYHCSKHMYLKKCYYTFLEVFSITELEQQRCALQTLYDTRYSHGNEYRNIRKTIIRQITKINQHINDIQNCTIQINTNALRRCRTCMETSDICNGCCWGFWKKTTFPTTTTSTTNDIVPSISVGDIVQPGPHWNVLKLGSKTTTSQNSSNGSVVNLRRGVIVEVKTIWKVGGADVAVRWYDDDDDDDNDDIEYSNVVNNLNSMTTGSVTEADNATKNDVSKDKKEKVDVFTKKDGKVKRKSNGSNYYPIIYRWGIVATNGQRRYDLIKVV